MSEQEPGKFFEQFSDQSVIELFKMGVYAENYDIRDKFFDEFDRRSLAAMDESERAEELQWRRRHQELTGISWRDQLIQVFTIAMIGSEAEKKAVLDAIIEPVRAVTDTYAGVQFLNQRIKPNLERVLNIAPQTPPQYIP